MKTAWNDKDYVQQQEAQSPCTCGGKAAGVETVTDIDTTPHTVKQKDLIDQHFSWSLAATEI